MTLLEPPLGVSAPIKLLELLWLASAVSYDKLDENIMEDTRWDFLGKELWARKTELTPYLTHSIQDLPWPVPEGFGEEGENPLVTASGVLYTKTSMATYLHDRFILEGVPAVVSHLQRLIARNN